MKKDILTHLSGTEKLSILLVLVLFSTIVIGGLGLIAAHLITNLSLGDSILLDFNHPRTILYLKIMQIFQAIGLFIAPPIIAVFSFQEKDEDYLQFRKTNIILIFLSALLIVSALPIINWLAEINQALILPESWSGIEQWMRDSEAAAGQITSSFLKADNVSTLFLNLFVMALIPAFGEEMLFRGVLQKLFIQISKNTHLGIWITAFIFSAIHMQFFTFLPRFFMGAMFGYMLVWSGSIWLTITAHFINNGTAVIINYLVQKGSVDSTIESVGSESISLFILSTLLVFSGMYFIKTSEKS
jgi:membrane protease YdiL (CAAX protease family)